MAKKIPAAVSEYMKRIGTSGGKQAGKTLTPKQRTERARKAATARWKTNTRDRGR